LRFVEEGTFFRTAVSNWECGLLVVRVRGQECPRHTNQLLHTTHFYLIVSVSNCAPLTT